MGRQRIRMALLLWCAAATSLRAEAPSGAPPPQPVSLEAVAHRYASPEELARFLRDTITPATDEALFGQPDYWQSPEEFLQRQAGDCEDYALFAQAILQQQGREAHVLSLFGEGGLAHTVCVFVDSGRYHAIDQDHLKAYGASTFAALASRLYPGWTHAALAQQFGSRGKLLSRIVKPRSHFSRLFSARNHLVELP